MNTSLSSPPPAAAVPHDADDARSPVRLVNRVPRTGPVDRLIMRFAVAMLIWSTRPDAEHTPHISELATSPYAPFYAAHAADDSLARGALMHGVYLMPPGR